MPVSDIILLSVAALLTAGLGFRIWRRARAPLPQTDWTGHGIDIAAVSERVQRVRRDFATELQTRPEHTCRRRVWLASARRAVGRSSYFRRRGRQISPCLEDEAETHPG
jgi:hypothetical protein